MKTYAFRFTARKADFYRSGGVGIVFGAANTVFAEEVKECTLAEAVAYLPVFSAASPAPHAAYFAMADRHVRKPAGYDKATSKNVYKPTAAA
jgi:hypothetical protein